MSMKLYGYWRSSASYRVRIALNVKQVAYEYIPVHLVNDGGQQHHADYQRLNPSELVPTLVDEDSDIILNQSLAIIEYLDESYEGGEQLIPQHRQLRARVRTIACDIACDIQPLGNLRVMQYLANEMDSTAQHQAKWAKHWIEVGLASVEKRLENTAGDYCFGFDLTLADVCLVPQVYNALRFEVDMAKYPLSKKIAENCNKLEAFIQAKPENQIDAVG
ncbi:MAG: maleylacetoacetate isomerase [Paraglaciecola sp.]|jgi:maleylacetoacetate isomerase